MRMHHTQRHLDEDGTGGLHGCLIVQGEGENVWLKGSG